MTVQLTNPYQNREDIVKSLFGILPKDVDVDAARQERLEGIFEDFYNEQQSKRLRV